MKTTEPCDQTKAKAPVAKFGSNQKKEIENLRSLAEPKYAAFGRYMSCLLRDYRDCFPTISFVLLSGNLEVSWSLVGGPDRSR